MKKLLIGGAAALLTVGLAAPVASVSAESNAKGGGACVQAGLSTLKSLGLLQAAAQKQVDYALIDKNGPGIPSLELPSGLITIDLGTSAKLSLGTVVSLHTSNPEYFAWC